MNAAMDMDDRKITMNFGPQHPAAHGVLRLVMDLDGEIVDTHRPAYRALASRHREIDRAQDLSSGDRLFRPPRLRSSDESGARFLPRYGTAPGHRCPDPRPIYPRALLRDRPHSQPPAAGHHAGDGRRRIDTAAVGFRRTREVDGVLRARVGQPDARDIFPTGRRARGPAGGLARRHPWVLRYIFPKCWTTSKGCSPKTASSSSAMSISGSSPVRMPKLGVSAA